MKELLYKGNPAIPTITVENYCKWYRLYVVYPDGRVEEIDFPEPRELKEAHCSDHVPNPKAVAMYAAEVGYAVHDESMEMIIGRWEREALNHYGETYQDGRI